MFKRIKKWFAWKVVRDSGALLYSENIITGDRKAVKISSCWQPLDYHWLQEAPSGKFQVYDERGGLAREANSNPPRPKRIKRTFPASPPTPPQKPTPPPLRQIRDGDFSGKPTPPPAPPDWDGWLCGGPSRPNQNNTGDRMTAKAFLFYMLIAVLGGMTGGIVKELIVGFWRGLTG